MNGKETGSMQAAEEGTESVSIVAAYDSRIFYNPSSRYCIIRAKSADTSIPKMARSSGRYKDHLIRFTAVGYEIPMMDAVELELEGQWVNSKHGVQLQVEQWREIVPQSEDGMISYLGSGLIKGIGEKTAAEIVARFGVDTVQILENHPERLLEIRGITENKLEDIKASYMESRMLRGLMTLLAPFKLTPKTALKVYQHFGPESMDILKKSPFELCQISGFGFRRVDAIIQKTNGRLNDPMRIRGAVYCILDEAKTQKGHLFLSCEDLEKGALRLLNEKVLVPELRVRKEEVQEVLQDMVLNGQVVSAKNDLYLPAVFAQEDETARRIARRLVERPPMEKTEELLKQLEKSTGLVLSSKQEAAVKMAFRYGLSIITGSPGTGKTTVLKMILEIYKKSHPDEKIILMAPTGRASRRMAESTGFDEAKTMHNKLGLTGEEEESGLPKKEQMLDAGLIIVDEFSLADMWLAEKFFSRVRSDTKIVLVGDPNQLPSVGAGNVFHELIECGLVPVTVLDRIFRQSEDSLIAYNARFINEGNTKLFYGNDFVFLNSDSQNMTAELIMEQYCQEISEHGIEKVQILSPFRSEGAAAAEQINEAIRERVNPFCSEEDEIRVGVKNFRIGDRIMQTQNTERVSNGDLGFIRGIKETPEGKKVVLDFGTDRILEYGPEQLVNLDLAYAATIHKMMGSEAEIIIMPVIKSHYIMLYRNLLYTGITRAKKKVILVGQKAALFMAIHKNDNRKRNTHLGMRICLYYRAFAKSAGMAVSAEVEAKLRQAS